MRKLILTLVLAASLSACGHKPVVRQHFKVCTAHDGSALVWFGTGMIGYVYDEGFNGQPKFRPHHASDMAHPAFMAESKFDPENPTICQDVVGRIID